MYCFCDISTVVDVNKLEHLFNIHLRKASSLIFIVGLPATLNQTLNNILQVRFKEAFVLLILAPTGAQGVTTCVCLSLWHKFVCLLRALNLHLYNQAFWADFWQTSSWLKALFKLSSYESIVIGDIQIYNWSLEQKILRLIFYFYREFFKIYLHIFIILKQWSDYDLHFDLSIILRHYCQILNNIFQRDYSIDVSFNLIKHFLGRRR